MTAKRVQFSGEKESTTDLGVKREEKRIALGSGLVLERPIGRSARNRTFGKMDRHSVHWKSSACDTAAIEGREVASSRNSRGFRLRRGMFRRREGSWNNRAFEKNAPFHDVAGKKENDKAIIGMW
ncbi:hypothetical protein CDAR_108781 [Caerostris darwini]|uniref:Uncharacterized protein n=1 Tax=Caerostris darwini TaxID=1538125 RepID=A0AAV4V5B2_9ARAC|nr:hypothetical protein CDAR_108781 [Caerostris darwini]